MRVMFALADKNDSIMYMQEVDLEKTDTLAYAAVKKAFNPQLAGIYAGYKWEELVQFVDERIDCILSYKEIK